MDANLKRMSKAEARQSVRSLVIRLMQNCENIGGLESEPEEVQEAFRELAWMIINPRITVACMPEDWQITVDKETL